MAEITQLLYYPVKGCAGVSVSQAEIDWMGLRYDRTFMVVGPEGVFFSQRRHREMAIIGAEIISDGAGLRLSYAGMEPLEIEVRSTGKRRDVSVFTWQGKGIDQGNSVAEWFSEVLGESCRLVKVPDDHDRKTSGMTSGTTGFSDGHAITMISTASLALLNERMATLGKPLLPMDRFRPNMVVSGWHDPHLEDEIRQMRISDAEFGFSKVCVRCSVTMVDQATGKRFSTEPIRELARYRRTPKGVAFGAKAAVIGTGQVAIGDKVIVQSWADPAFNAAAAEPPLTANAITPWETG